MKNNMLNKLKSNYEELEIKPSSDLWDRLESNLEEKPEIVLKPSFQWWKYAAVIVLFISLGSLFYVNSNQSDADKVKIVRKTSETIQKPLEKQNEEVALNEKPIQNQVSSESGKKNNTLNSISEKFSEKIESKDIAGAEKENIIVEVPSVLVEKQETNIIKPVVADRKKVSYISADDLLLGRELNETRKETQNHKQFGVLDVSKIKIKRPNSLQVFGFKVFQDSTTTE
jgi:hypothetical protein